MTESKFWRRGALGFAVAAIVLASLWLWPVVVPQWWQDRCSFGTVSNADYRELLVQGRSQIAPDDQDWRAHVANRRSAEAARILQGQFSKLAENLSTIDERIAAMHALARAHGAQFRRAEPDNPAPWAIDPEAAPEAIHFVYRLRLDRLGSYRLRRWVRFDGTFAVRDMRPGFERARGTTGNTLTMTVTGTDLTPRLRSVRRSDFHDCPPVPNSAWQATYAQRSENGALRFGGTPAPERKSYRDLLTIADNFMARDRIRLAIPLLERALLLAEAGYGANHESVAVILERLGTAFRAVGQPLRAAEYDGRAIDVRIRMEAEEAAAQ